jgi:hypothetical protein
VMTDLSESFLLALHFYFRLQIETQTLYHNQLSDSYVHTTKSQYCLKEGSAFDACTSEDVCLMWKSLLIPVKKGTLDIVCMLFHLVLALPLIVLVRMASLFKCR